MSTSDGDALVEWLAKAAPDQVWWMGTPPPCFSKPPAKGNGAAELVLQWAQQVAGWVVGAHGGGTVGVTSAGAARLTAARAHYPSGVLDVGPRGHRIEIPSGPAVRMIAPVAWVRVPVNGDLNDPVVAFIEYPGLYDDLPGLQTLAADVVASELVGDHRAAWRNRGSRSWVNDP